MPTTMQHPKQHFTTRRGFVASAGFGGISLYGLWAAYGAAPGPLTLLGLDGAPPATQDVHAQHGAPATAPDPSAHAGHGAATSGPSSEEFSRMTAEFSERYRLPDGTVYPRPLAAAHSGHGDPHAGHDLSDMPDMVVTPPATPAAHSAHAQHGTAPAANTSQPPSRPTPVDVLMTAGRWYYLPNLLRLDAGQPYRFRMMALDVTHGASIQFGKGGRMVRLAAGQLTETELTFLQRGRYLMHCTVYCGQAHDVMQATIEVV